MNEHIGEMMTEWTVEKAQAGEDSLDMAVRRNLCNDDWWFRRDLG